MKLIITCEFEPANCINIPFRPALFAFQHNLYVPMDVNPSTKALWIASATQNIISVINPVDDKVIDSFQSSGKHPARLKFSRDGRLAYIVHGEDNALTVFDVTKKKKKVDIHLPASPKILFISPDGKKAFITYPDNDLFSVIDLEKKSVVLKPLHVVKCRMGLRL